jgi:NADH-quinone oxidoreductase subunit N
MDSVLINSFYPEIFLSFSILIQLLFNVQLIHSLKFNAPLVISEVASQSIFILICVFLLLLKLKIEGIFSNFLFINDESTRLSKILLVISLILIFEILVQSFCVQKLNFIEYFSLLLLSVLSMFLLISAYDLISFYLTIEMQALCFYVMASFKKNSSFSTEAGLKYFIAGSFISAFFLLGCSLIYGCLGTLNLHDLHLILFVPLSSVSDDFKTFVFIGIFFITSTLLFKLACAPFHFWAPDVYEGSPLVSTIVFSILPKIAILIFFIKWICCVESGCEQIKSILFYIGLFSIILGTFFSLNQLRLKRLMIYSSVAQVGFIICAISLTTLGGFSSSLFFLFIYIISSVLIWSYTSILYFNQHKYNSFKESFTSIIHVTTFTKFFTYNKLWATCILVVFFSIAGIPPLTGFLAKILILVEVVRSEKLFLSIVILVISAVGVYYYLRVIKISFFEPILKNSNITPFFVVFNTVSLKKIYTSMAFCFFLLLIIFFLPTEICLLSEYIILSIVPF